MRYRAPSRKTLERFHQGVESRAYELFGAHPVTENGEESWRFSLYAPGAARVSLVGDFNEWSLSHIPMLRQPDGVWTLSVPRAAFPTPIYKYAIVGKDGVTRFKQDPYGFSCELRPNTASRLTDMSHYEWRDAQWMAERAEYRALNSPLSIYEVHLGSWQRRGDGGFLSYDELRERLIPYVKDLGFTHIELMPVMEHPLDRSWGYQVSGFFAPTARFGEPEGLKAFIDACHQTGIGVILDWVPAHFPRDEAGLDRLDGTNLYCSDDPRRADMPLWGTKLFDLSQGEVVSFLLSSACFWLDEYHADGLRVDAVSCMLYHDFCKKPGEYLPNAYGGRENLSAIRFFRLLNDTLADRFPGCVTFAEESTSYPMVTRKTYLGGLGFTFKWNMGWMNDMLTFISADFEGRRRLYDRLTFPMMYAFSENHLLPLSHDEVVYGKKSLLSKNPGDSWQRYAGLRAFLGYWMAYPGKKLLFMGAELAQEAEWDFDASLAWLSLAQDKAAQVSACLRALLLLYRSTPALYRQDSSWDGYQWLILDDKQNAAVSFLRKADDGDALLCAASFMPVFYPIYRIGLPCAGTLREVFNSDRAEFGGSNQYNAYELTAQKGEYGGHPYWVEICLPPLGCVYLSFTMESARPRKRIARFARLTQSVPRHHRRRPT